jgi:hypothetical protein
VPASPAQLAAAAPAVIDLFERLSTGITHTLPAEEPP